MTLLLRAGRRREEGRVSDGETATAATSWNERKEKDVKRRRRTCFHHQHSQQLQSTRILLRRRERPCFRQGSTEERLLRGLPQRHRSLKKGSKRHDGELGAGGNERANRERGRERGKEDSPAFPPSPPFLEATSRASSPPGVV